MSEFKDIFPRGELNKGFEQYFSGKSFVSTVTNFGVDMINVTFEPGCRNNWHIHTAKSGGGQILLCTAGEGWYQEYGKEPRKLHPGDVVEIAPGVKHWHGAAKNSWFSHIAVSVPGEEKGAEWCEAVSDEEYEKLQ